MRKTSGEHQGGLLGTTGRNTGPSTALLYPVTVAKMTAFMWWLAKTPPGTSLVGSVIRQAGPLCPNFTYTQSLALILLLSVEEEWEVKEKGTYATGEDVWASRRAIQLALQSTA